MDKFICEIIVVKFTLHADCKMYSYHFIDLIIKQCCKMSFTGERNKRKKRSLHWMPRPIMTRMTEL